MGKHHFEMGRQVEHPSVGVVLCQIFRGTTPSEKDCPVGSEEFDFKATSK